MDLMWRLIRDAIIAKVCTLLNTSRSEKNLCLVALTALFRDDSHPKEERKI